MQLVVEIYDEKNENRMQEYVSCLEKNAANDTFSRVMVFVQSCSTDEKRPSFRRLKEVFGNEKVCRLLTRGQRMMYSDYFEYVNIDIPKGEVAVVANADVWFDGSSRFIDDAVTDDRPLFLSRTEPDGSRCIGTDAWAFRVPIKPFSCAFYPGTAYCDQRLAFEARAAGYDPFNPSLSIILHHEHGTGIHNYDIYEKPCGGRFIIPQTTLDTAEGR